jgi:hypothetical protein
MPQSVWSGLRLTSIHATIGKQFPLSSLGAKTATDLSQAD